MHVHVYKFTCLTNLHVGSGEINYNIVDNEVECDPTTGLPMIHASGVKGAMREHFAKTLDAASVNRIFGAPPKQKEAITAGSYRFMDAGFLCRPMRVANSAAMASINVVSFESLNRFLAMLNAFGVNPFGITHIDADPSVFGNAQFLTNYRQEPIRVEDEATLMMPPQLEAQIRKLSGVIGTNVALVKNFEDYPLPVLARNQLEKGESKNLWYEQVVPHDSVFFELILTPDNNMELELEKNIIQFGGNASIGCGFVQITKLTETGVAK
jgi:CRISPR-associated protein Cmr4